jgi:hypothetical protein
LTNFQNFTSQNAPTSLIRTGAAFSSLSFVAGFALLIKNHIEPKVISIANSTNTSTKELEDSKTGEFNQIFALSFITLSAIAFIPVAYLFEKKNERERREKTQEENKSAMLKMNPDRFLESFGELSSTFSQEQKIDVLNDFLQKNKNDNQASRRQDDIYELTKSEMLKMNSDQFLKSFDKLLPLLTEEQQLNFLKSFLEKDSNNINIEIPQEQRLESRKNSSSTMPIIIQSNEDQLEGLKSKASEGQILKTTETSSSTTPNIIKLTEDRLEEFKSIASKMNPNQFREFFKILHDTLVFDDKQDIVRAHLEKQNQKNETTTSHQILNSIERPPSPEPRITSTQPQEASLMRNETELRRGVDGGGVYSTNREGSERV